MSFQVSGPRWPVVALTTAVVVFVLGFSVSTQGPGRGRIVRVNGYEAVEGEVLIKYRDDRVAASHAEIEAAADADVVESLDRRGGRRMRSRRLRTTELMSLLAQDPDVEFVEPNYLLRAEASPNDPSFPSLWGLFNTGLNTVGGGGIAGADIDAPAAWDITTGSRANVVAIVDTGIDYNHPDLAANMWSAPSSFQVTVGGMTITCQAGTHGFNAITRTCDPMDDQYHGTHVAGTIGASGNNAAGVVGVNWTASMMGIKFLGASGSGYTSDAVLGLEFAMQAKAAFASTRGANVRVLSNSWGGGSSQSLLNAINAANGSDMLFVAAAGNSGSNNDTAPHYPSSYPTANMVAVASSDNSDQRSSFSNYGASSVHLAAPGSAILSTLPGNSYGVLYGTSMATPHVSGAAMLALSMCYLSTAELKSLLLTSADPVAAFSGITTTGGRLNVRAAVQSCQRPKATSLAVTSDVASPQELGATVTWTATAGGPQGPYEYRWFLWDGAASTTLRNWSSNPTLVWTPSTASASYQLTVQARGPFHQGVAEVSVTKPFAIFQRATSVTLTPNLVAPQAPGTSITWTASAAGGLAPYQYRFLVWGGSAWSEARAWDTSNVFTWTPSVASPDYKVAVLVRSAGNTGPNEITTAQPFAIRPFAMNVTLTADLPAPQVTGRGVTFSASASGGEAPYQYQFVLWDGVAWTVVRDWSTYANFVWNTLVADPDYRMVVKARSAWNTGASEVYTALSFPIFSPITNLTLTPNVTVRQLVGSAVTVTAAASGGQGAYQYQWRVGNPGWTVAQSWSSSNAFAWTPTSAGTYTIQAQVRNALSTAAAEREQNLNYQILNPLTATLASNLSSPRPSGATIRWTATVTGPSQPRYQWFLFDGTSWVNLTGWTTENWFYWTPAVPNANYRVGVRVRSDWNTGPAESTVILPFVIQ